MPGRPAHNAAQWRKRLRRELLRVGAGGVSLYIDGPRGTARLRFPDHEGRFSVPADEALRRLRSLPDGAGVDQTADVIAPTEPGQSAEPDSNQLSGATAGQR